MKTNEITFGDMLAGGGGTSTGAYLVPGLHVSWAINHDPIAIATHQANHPETVHFVDNIMDPSLLAKLDHVDVLWASLECTQHSRAKGGQDKEVGSFMLGWQMITYLTVLKPMIMIVENVPEFIRWGELKYGQRVKGQEGGEYVKWVNAIKRLGYTSHTHAMLNAADYGAPTRRVRYIGYFALEGIRTPFPDQTNHQTERNLYGLPKWRACKDFIDLTHEGNSIFGRSENPEVAKGKRHQLSENTMKRIAGGIKKFAPQFNQFISTYYGNGINAVSIDEPMGTIRTHESHALVTIEKKQFISDHCWQSNFNDVEEPMKVIMTRQTKELITIVDKLMVQHYSGDHSSSIDQPLPTITTTDHNSIITAKAQFLSMQYNSNGNPGVNNSSLDVPCPSISTQEKIQFITAYFNSSGNPGSQNQSICNPLNSIQTMPNKQALVTAIMEGLIDFDIKMRFLDYEELAAIMTFPKDYFKHSGLKLTRKQIHKMIGNAVPPVFAQAILAPIKTEIENYKSLLLKIA